MSASARAFPKHRARRGVGEGLMRNRPANTAIGEENIRRESMKGTASTQSSLRPCRSNRIAVGKPSDEHTPMSARRIPRGIHQGFLPRICLQPATMYPRGKRRRGTKTTPRKMLTPRHLPFTAHYLSTLLTAHCSLPSGCRYSIEHGRGSCPNWRTIVGSNPQWTMHCSQRGSAPEA